MINSNYSPSGVLCKKCEFRIRDCDHLPFHNMEIIDRCSVSLIKIVKCSQYLERLDKTE